VIVCLSLELVFFRCPQRLASSVVTIGVRRGVSKGVEDGRRSSALRAGYSRSGCL
jgi:hypothetical protein